MRGQAQPHPFSSSVRLVVTPATTPAIKTTVTGPVTLMIFHPCFPPGRVGRLVWLAIVLLASWLPAPAIPKSPWTAVWSGRLGDAGVIALKVVELPTGEITSAQVWWLVDPVPVVSPPRLENDTLFVDRLDHMNKPA